MAFINPDDEGGDDNIGLILLCIDHQVVLKKLYVHAQERLIINLKDIKSSSIYGTNTISTFPNNINPLPKKKK